jgi:MFS family permease
MTNLPAQPRTDSYASLRIKDFRLFVLSRFLLTVGIQIQSTIVGWQIYDITQDVLALGMIGLAEAIPFMSVTLYGGHLADLFSRRKIILLSLGAYLIAATLLLLITLNLDNIHQLYGTLPIYLVICLTGIARGFAGPSFSAFVVQLVPRELLASAVAWNTTFWQAAAVSGPALGGIVYGILSSAFTKTIGTAYTYGIVLTLVILAMICMGFIGEKLLPKAEMKETLGERLASGIRFVFQNQVILGALSLDLFAVFFGGAVALLPAFAKEILHVGPEGLGMLRAAPSIGSVVMGLFLAHRPIKDNAGIRLLWFVAGYGLCMIAFALSQNFYLSLAILALSGALDNVSVIIRSTILQLLTPDSMRGRVSAVNSIFIGSSNEIGSFESGVAARLLKLVPSVIFGGTMTLLVVAITSRLAPKLRKLDLTKIE